jgi:hypothetical protein
MELAQQAPGDHDTAPMVAMLLPSCRASERPRKPNLGRWPASGMPLRGAHPKPSPLAAGPVKAAPARAHRLRPLGLDGAAGWGPPVRIAPDACRGTQDHQQQQNPTSSCSSWTSSIRFPLGQMVSRKIGASPDWVLSDKPLSACRGRFRPATTARSPAATLAATGPAPP